MKKLFWTFLFVVISFPAFAADKESAYERVMKAQTIRCGYGSNKPWIYEDLEKGGMKGLYVDIMDEVAKQLSLKLDWPEETGWGNLPTSLMDGRVDVACSTMWIDPARARQVAYTRSIFYTPIYAYARADDKRFTGKPEELDDPSVRIITQDSDITGALARRYYARAKHISLPQTAMWSDLYLSVTTGKADIAFAEPVSVQQFNENQTVKLKRVELPAPIVVYGNAYAVGIHEHELKEMLDATVSYLLDTGRIQALTDDFEKKYPGSIISVGKPYEAPQ